MFYVHNQCYDISCAILYIFICKDSYPKLVVFQRVGVYASYS